MNKVFKDRVVEPSQTISLQKEYIDSSLGIEYYLEFYTTPDNYFWVSKIELLHFSTDDVFKITRGKGTSKEECLASNYGEFLERLSWELWKSKNVGNNKIPATNLLDGSKQSLSYNTLIQHFQNAEYLAAGNTIEEARYHALCDIFENGVLINHFPFNNLYTSIADTTKFNLNTPQKYHDNYHMLVQVDSRIPSVYMATVFRYPEESDIQPDFFELNNDGLEINGFNIEKPKMMNNPWPPIAGKRIGLNVEKLFEPAIGESIQLHHANQRGEFILHDNPKKLYPTHFQKNIKYSNNETLSPEGDCNKIINEFREAGFSLWEIDVTLPGSPMKVVKLLSDYSLNGEHILSKQFLSRLFVL